MNISKSHQIFSELLKNPRVLSNPQEFLGPNYETVLNFWLILDELTKDQWRTIWSRYWDFYDLQLSEWRKAADESIEASDETIERDFADNAVDAVDAAWDVYGYTAGWATRELIGMHKFFEQQKPLSFFQMFLEVL